MDKLQWGDRVMLLFLNGKSDGDGGSSSGGAVVKKKTTSRVADNNITNNVNNCGKDGSVLPAVPSPRRSNSGNPCIMETQVYSRKNVKLRRDEDCWIDQISRLPDELLVCILSCLSLKEAAASSILSHRWRHLWTFISKLDFEGSDLWTTYISMPDCDNYISYLHSKHAAAKREREYVGWVDKVLGLRDKSTNVDELRISFNINEAHQSYIDRWIGFALDKKVVRLDLNLAQSLTYFKVYTFPYKLLCNNDSHSWGFKGLRLIRMVSVKMSDAALDIFLHSCPLLEEIFFSKCQGLSTVKIVNMLPALKRLSLIRCFHLKSVEVHDSNLVYFMYRGNMKKHFLLKNVPLLVEMNVGGQVTYKVDEFLTMFSSHLPQLEKLMVEKHEKLCIMEAKMICSSVKMSNLKQLVWKFVGFYDNGNLMPLTILIGALPLLQRLVLLVIIHFRKKSRWNAHSNTFPPNSNGFYPMQSYDDRKKAVVGVSHHHLKRTTTNTYTYSHLKQVEFAGYHGVGQEFQILADIIDNAAALEEVIIHPARVTLELGDYTKQQIDACRACAKAQLSARLPSTATLKIL